MSADVWDDGARLVVGCDRAPAFFDRARRHTVDPRAQFVVGPSDPLPAGPFDACVAGLVLDFMPDPAEALKTSIDAGRPGGAVAAHVWDYTQGMELMRVRGYRWTRPGASP